MKIRFVRPWRGRAVGQEIDTLPEGVAKTLIERGYAEAVTGKQRKPKPLPSV